MQWGPIWMVTNLSNPPLFFSNSFMHCLTNRLSLSSISFLFFLSPFPPFLPSATAAAADVPMNCGKVRVQGLQRIILIYAGAGPVAKQACRPPARPCWGCAPVLRLPSGRAAAALCTAGEMGCRCTCRFSSFAGRRCMIYL